jgi:hypothetical protein
MWNLAWGEIAVRWAPTVCMIGRDVRKHSRMLRGYKSSEELIVTGPSEAHSCVRAIALNGTVKEDSHDRRSRAPRRGIES